VVEDDVFLRVLLGDVCLADLPFLVGSSGGTLRYILGSVDCRDETSLELRVAASVPSFWIGEE